MIEIINGYIQEEVGDGYIGRLSIEGVDLSPIDGTYFEEDGVKYLWLKRKPMLEYDYETMSYKNRPREPRWECYMKKQFTDDGVVAYKGTFFFLRYKWSIIGTWDVGMRDKSRLNLFVERLPNSEQTIIQSINKRNRELHGIN